MKICVKTAWLICICWEFAERIYRAAVFPLRNFQIRMKARRKKNKCGRNGPATGKSREEVKKDRGCRRKTKALPQTNVSVLQGTWGESVAERWLVEKGWEPIGRRVRPCRFDRRYEIDLIVRSADGTRVVFVEVKTHAVRSPLASRLWRINRAKRRVLLLACEAWLKQVGWHGHYRFDVIEVYGRKNGTLPEIDHIENVPLFPPRYRFL